jgi:hypothetical protein
LDGPLSKLQSSWQEDGWDGVNGYTFGREPPKNLFDANLVSFHPVVLKKRIV